MLLGDPGHPFTQFVHSIPFQVICHVTAVRGINNVIGATVDSQLFMHTRGENCRWNLFWIWFFRGECWELFKQSHNLTNPIQIQHCCTECHLTRHDLLGFLVSDGLQQPKNMMELSAVKAEQENRTEWEQKRQTWTVEECEKKKVAWLDESKFRLDDDQSWWSENSLEPSDVIITEQASHGREMVWGMFSWHIHYIGL